MKKLKALASLGLVGAMSLSLVACGSNDNQTETTESETAMESTTEYVDMSEIETVTEENIDEVEAVSYIGYLMGMEEMDNTAYTGTVYYFDVLVSGIEQENTTDEAAETEEGTVVETEEATSETEETSEVETTTEEVETASETEATTEEAETTSETEATTEEVETASETEATLVEDGETIEISEPEEEGIGYRGKMVLFVAEGADEGINPTVGEYYRLDVSPYMTMSIPPQAELRHMYEASDADIEYFNSMKEQLSTYEDCLETYTNGAMLPEEILYDAVSQCGYWTDEQVIAFREWFTSTYEESEYDVEMFGNVRTSEEEIESIREALEAESIAIEEAEAAEAEATETETSTEEVTETETSTEASTEDETPVEETSTEVE